MRTYFFLIVLWTITTTILAQDQMSPRLEKQASTTRLIVKGKPFLILGGELHNSSTSGTGYMRPIWKDLVAKNLNTAIAAAYWELVEPREGEFDFTLVDSMILGARKEGLHMVVIWFGSWKNGYSTYAPSWVKNDVKKYPRAKDANGKTLQHLSTFGEATMQADARAFKALLKHIRDIDEKEQTVIMVQVENEMGLFTTARDHTEAADKAYSSQVPKDLTDYLLSQKGKLQPELDSVWKANGYKTNGTWEQIFGKSIVDEKNWKTLSYLTEELFTVYQYAKYTGKIAMEGKEAYPLPMYVNAWLKQEGIYGSMPGKYPSGGPLPHTLDIWRAAAPAIDIIVPDIYVPDARVPIEQYDRPFNANFIPEIRAGIRSANEALWAFGEHNIFGISPFGIDGLKAEDDPITQTYDALSQVKDLIIQHQGKGSMTGILVDTDQPVQAIDLGGYTITAELGRSENFTNMAGQKTNEGPSVAGGILINIAPDEFIAVGKDYRLTFVPSKPEKNTLLDVDFMDEGTFVNGKWISTRRLNGDEGTGGGDPGFGNVPKQPAATLRFQQYPDGRYSIIRYKIYKYK